LAFTTVFLNKEPLRFIYTTLCNQQIDWSFRQGIYLKICTA